ncbi:unnamed protein product [Gulo gulo]|uniref:Uncharacterized protein n=1 Tax=Gulo gulo TaxID=48420 RepID=A0A9X9MD85_GULGU|nr:unnamed protein product [Gulo gulo]
MLPDFILLTINFEGNIEVHSFKLIHLPFSVSPGKIQTPGACKSLLCAHPHTVPRSPVLSTASLEEESHGEASSSQTRSSECDEALLIFKVRREIKRDRAAPKEAWKSPVLAKNMTKKPIRSHSVTPLDLEAAGTHISRHVRLQNRCSYNSRGDSAPLGPLLPCLPSRSCCEAFQRHRPLQEKPDPLGFVGCFPEFLRAGAGGQEGSPSRSSGGPPSPKPAPGRAPKSGWRRRSCHGTRDAP